MTSIDQMLSMMSRDDLDFPALLNLARDKSVASRTRLVESVGDLFFEKNRTLSDRERALMTEILRRLIHDVEMSVRTALAERLSAEPTAPAELVKTLANDDIEVAYNILVKSPVLQDGELIEIVQHRTLEHQLAITLRAELSAAVSDALVATGNADVIKSLIDNMGAEISSGTIEYLVEQSKRVDAYQNPLLNRPDLPPALAKRMYWWVSAALRKHIIRSFNFDPVELDERIEDVIKDILSQEAGDPIAGCKGADLAKLLNQRHALSPQLMVQTLRRGEVALFEAMFAELTGLREKLVRRILFEPGGQGLAVVCRAMAIAKPDFASLFLLSRSARPSDKVVDPNELSAAMVFFDRVKRDPAERLLRRMRLDSEYLESMLALDGADDEDAPAIGLPRAANSNG
jgi:uncharacterized protein (DUF2336 family)